MTDEERDDDGFTREERHDLRNLQQIWRKFRPFKDAELESLNRLIEHESVLTRIAQTNEFWETARGKLKWVLAACAGIITFLVSIKELTGIGVFHR